MAIAELLDQALRCTKDLGLYFYVAPMLKQAKAIAWLRLKLAVTPLIQHGLVEINESELWVRFTTNGAQIRLYGADNPDSLRGPYFDGVVFDEFGDMYPDVWFEVVRPMLSDRQGEAIFTGTPRGFDHFYDLWLQANERASEGWATFQYTTLQGGNVPPHEVEAARRDLSPRIFRQEYEASFEAVAGRVFDSFNRSHNCHVGVADLGGAADRTAGPVEGGQEAVAERLDLAPLVARQGVCRALDARQLGLRSLEVHPVTSSEIGHVLSQAVPSPPAGNR